jgi:ribosomal protein S27E
MLDSSVPLTNTPADVPTGPGKARKSRARKTSTKPTRIYSYRILPPEDPAHRKLVDDQFWLAHQYRCRLIEIEIELRTRFRDVDLAHPLTREATMHWEAQNTALDKTYADLRAAKSGRAPEAREDAQIKQRLSELKGSCTRAWRDVKASRAEAKEHHQPRYAEARKLAAEQRLAARGEFSARGLLHGTYINIERSVERSVDSTGRPPKSPRYEGEGLIGRQLPRVRDTEGSWTLCLKKFEEAKADYPEADRALQLIGELHQIDARAEGDLEQRARLRATEAADVIAELKIWLTEQVARKKLSIGKASAFVLANWESLTRFLGDASISLDGRLYSVTADDLYSMEDSRVRMTRLPDGWEQLPRTARRRIAKPYRGVAKRQRHGEGWQEIPARLNGQYVEMQFGWGPAERPSTWIRFPLTHHRRMPADAEILWAYIHRWRIGIHYEWRVQLTIESETFHRPVQPLAAGGTCAIDIGWRRIFDPTGKQIGLRVAYLVDEYGTEREIRAPDGLWEKLAKIYSLAQIRSRELNAIRDRLVAWIGTREMPAWFTDRARGLPQWRAPRKLQRLVDTWQREENRFDAGGAPQIQDDAEMLAVLQAWAKQDRHLGSWEAHMRDRTIANRREQWRRVAMELARTYQTILVEDGLCRSEGREGQMKIVDIEGWDKLPPEEGDPHEGREQRRQARMAAPGELRLAIAQATHKTASTVIDVARGKKSTCECAWCGHVQVHADFAAAIEIQCEGCGRTWDQDANAARNLLHRRGLTSGPVSPMPPGSAGGVALPTDGKAAKRSRQSKDSGNKRRRDVGQAPA